MAEWKLDLKKALKAIDLRDVDFYDNLTEEEKKGFSPYLMMRFAASNQSTNPLAHQICVQGVNELVNVDFEILSKHPKLFWMLLALGGVGSIQFHPWMNYKSKKSNKKTIKFLEEQFPTMKQDDLELMVELNDNKTLIEWARELGWDKKEIKEKLG